MVERVVPNAMIVGPMRSGTTWIQDYLKFRGDVVLPRGVKETFFFDLRYEKGIEWYLAHFRRIDKNRQNLAVEVGPSYFHSVHAPERIRAVLGDIPLVVTLRDPIRRTWSHYLHLRRYGYTTLPLRQAVRDFPEILEASRYRTCLRRWEDVFGGGRISILWQEHLARSVDDYAKSLCLGLSLPFVAPPEALRERRNQAAVPASFLMAAIGDRTAHFLRANRLYSIVNLAKRLGLKRLFFGKPGASALPQITDSEWQWLAEELRDEMPSDASNRGT